MAGKKHADAARLPSRPRCHVSLVKFGRTSDNMKLAPDCINSPENIDVALLILSINILSSDLLKVG